MTAAMALTGPVAWIRRKVLEQVRTGHSAALYLGDDPMVLVMFGRHGWRRVEFGFAISPAAVPHMRRVVRAAQLTLAPLAQDRLVVAVIHPDNAAGQRMARLVGFRRARTKNPKFWIFRGDYERGT